MEMIHANYILIQVILCHNLQVFYQYICLQTNGHNVISCIYQIYQITIKFQIIISLQTLLRYEDQQYFQQLGMQQNHKTVIMMHFESQRPITKSQSQTIQVVDQLEFSGHASPQIRSRQNIDEMPEVTLIKFAEQSYKKENQLNEGLNVLDKDGFNEQQYFKLAKAYRKIHNYMEEKKCYEKIILINPNNLSAYQNLGHLYFDAKKWDMALKNYQKLIEIDSKYSKAYYNIGTVLNQAERWEESIQYFQKYLQLQPNDHEAFNNLGDVMIQIGNKEASLKYFLKAIELFPNDSHAYNNLGNLYLYQQPLKAIKYYKKGIEVDPEFSQNYNGLGVAYNSTKNYEKAIQSYEKAIQLYDQDADYFHNIAAAYKNLKNFDEATKYYKKAIELDPKHYLSLEGLAKIFHHSGKIKGAIQLYSKVLQIHPYEVTYYNLAILYEGLGKFDEAVKYFQQYLSIKPKDSKVQRKLAKIYAFIGEKQQSKKNVKTVDSQKLSEGIKMLKRNEKEL